MLILKKISQVREFVSQQKKADKKIAFVPTMGALHLGHISLFEEARKAAPIVVASIFVNKAQFNDLNDFKNYPKQIEEDLKKLENAGVDAVFIPTDEEMFVSDFAFKIAVEKLVDCLCGATRAGHFDGVALVVTKLFNIVNPDFAVFGEKDFQQVIIVKKLVEDFNFNIEIIVAKTKREESGLAMSSRNLRLSESARIKAAQIFKTLNEIKENPKLIEEKKAQLLKNGFEKIDYLEIRDEKNLDLISDFSQKKSARIFIAIYLENVRLIDNISANF